MGVKLAYLLAEHAYTDWGSTMKKLLGVLLTSILGTSYALATPIQWSSSVGGNDHWYEYIGQNLDWTTARTLALAQIYAGLPGYLVTITSEAENNFVTALTGGLEAWIGASDRDVEGEWRWMDGPEAGLLFWLGDFTGQAFGYANWRQIPTELLEPNNFGDEDYANIYRGPIGYWNDRENRNTEGYLVEYSSLTPPEVVPEPASIPLMLTGFAALGVAMRKRRDN